MMDTKLEASGLLVKHGVQIATPAVNTDKTQTEGLCSTSQMTLGGITS
jgi:hypothetical protein